MIVAFSGHLYGWTGEGEEGGTSASGTEGAARVGLIRITLADQFLLVCGAGTPRGCDFRDGVAV